MNSVSAQSQEVAAILTFLESFNASWMKLNVEALKAMLHPEVIFVSGERIDQEIKGRDACLSSIQEFTSQAKTHSFKVLDTQVSIWQQTANLRFDYAVVYEMEEQTFEEGGAELWTLSKKEGKWKLCWRGLLLTEAMG